MSFPQTLRSARITKFSGFTLAELIVVITILAVLSTVGFLALSEYRHDAKVSAVKANVRTVYSAIAAESAATSVSARCFINHDAQYALSGAFVVFDGKSESLVGGPCTQSGTNYSVGNPDYAKLRLNPEKFRITLRDRFVRFATEAFASADPSLLIVGATDLQDGKRIRSFAQVAGIEEGTAYLSGDFPSGSTDGSAAGLVKDPGYDGPLVDGAPTGAPAPCEETSHSGFTVPFAENGTEATLAKSTEDGNGTVELVAKCSYGTFSYSDETVSCSDGFVRQGDGCVSSYCVGTAYDVANAFTGAELNGSAGVGTWTYSTTPGNCRFKCADGFSWNGSVCKADCATEYSGTHEGLQYPFSEAFGGAVILQSGGSGSRTAEYPFGESSALGKLTADFSFSCDNGTMTSSSAAGTGSCVSAPGYAWNSSWTAPSCDAVKYAVSGSFGVAAGSATVTGCAGKTATADASGNFSFADVPYGTDCSGIAVVKPSYSCSVSKNGPASLTGAVSDIAGTCSFNVQSLAGSLRFSGMNSYISRTPSTPGNQKKWTWSGWVKTIKNGGTQNILTSGSSVTNYGVISLSAAGFLDSTDTLKIYTAVSNSTQTALASTALYKDPSAWYHLIVSVDTTDSISSNRVRAYVNGDSVALSGTFPPQNADLAFFNTASAQYMGTTLGGSYGYFSGYFADIHFVDGLALAPASFGEKDPTTGSWKPVSYAGTYGTNGFRLNFSDTSSLTSGSNAGLGKDSSGNGNYWNTNGFALSDRVIDHPTNNFSTLNPMLPANVLYDGYYAIVPAAGALKITGSASPAGNSSLGTVSSFSHKGFFEGTMGAAGAGTVQYGLKNVSTGKIYAYDNSGNKVMAAFSSAYGSSFTTGDVVGVAFDLSTGSLEFYKNGLSQGFLSSVLPAGDYVPFLYASNGSVSTANFGQGGQSGLTYYSDAGGFFKYAPPSGFKALSTKNLPTPAIASPKSYFDVLTYVGDGATSKSVGGLSFQPDLVWLKNRSATSDQSLFDSVRGATKRLRSNQTYGENAEAMASFDSNGFTVLSAGGASNVQNNNFVAWNWKKGSLPGFDIVTYTGNGSNTRQIAHSLEKVPAMYFTKNLDGYNSAQGYNDWSTYHKSLPQSGASGTNGPQPLWLHSVTNVSSGVGGFCSIPTSSYFAPNQTSYDNVLNKTYVAYLWSEVPGFSKFGSYVGNGSSDGPFVYTGFRPKWIMIRQSTSANSWVILDTSRSPFNDANRNALFADLASYEQTDAYPTGIHSNGFKVRNGGTGGNTSGSTYIYAAFAEYPFGGSGITPATAR